MLYPEEHSADLKRWIVKRLENTSDADADVLADYVLALLRHDGDAQAVRSLCEAEIPDFLKEDTTVFVNDVFEAIANKSYLPGAPQPRPQQQQHQQQQHQYTASVPSAPADPYGLIYDDVPIPQGPQAPPPAMPNDPRKRTFNDRSEAGAQNGRESRFDVRPYKQPRRGGGGFGGGGRGGGKSEDWDSPKGAGLPVPPFPPLPGQQTQFAFPPPPPNALFDPEALKAYLEMTAVAHNFAPFFPAQPSRQPGRRRPRCRDYDTKGYCSRGNTCNFEHGDDSLYTPQVPALFGHTSATNLVEEYDPANALLPNIFNTPSVGQIPHNGGPGTGRPNSGRGGRHHGQSKRHRGRAPFSADGPVLDKTKSTIVVENIPEENLTEDQVREFFSQFGTVLEVTMQAYKRLAIVKFDSWAAANAAYKSPKVVFENRFVKIFWHKDEDTSSSANGAGANGSKKARGSSVAGHSESGAIKEEGGTPPPEIDMEEIFRHLEEAQKIHEEKTMKIKEIEAQREEVEKRRRELEAKQREAKVALQKLLQKKRGENDDSSKPKSTSEALRAQLAALEAEAMELGIDPDAPPPENETTASHWGAPRGGRGGYPSYRSRGYAPRGFRGGFRGGRGNNHALYAMYSVDNRPKRVTLTGVDFTIPEKDEMLRQYLFGVGEFTSIETSPTETSISFKDRKTAEKFFNEVTLNGGEIPGLKNGGQVELAWSGGGGGPTVASSSAVSSAAGTPGSTAGVNMNTTTDEIIKTTATGGGAGKNGTSVGGATTTTHIMETETDDHHSGSDDKDVNIILDYEHHHHLQGGNNQPQQNNDSMDYDVADENQWD